MILKNKKFSCSYSFDFLFYLFFGFTLFVLAQNFHFLSCNYQVRRGRAVRADGKAAVEGGEVCGAETVSVSIPG